MSDGHTNAGSAFTAGLFAGLMGTSALAAMRKFDEKYAPQTMPQMTEDPAAFIVHSAEKVVPLPEPIERLKIAAAPLAYGALIGGAYGLCCADKRPTAPLFSGVVLGSAAYVAGYAGWLPALGLCKPIWKQEFPQIAGELLRHVAYGVTTAAIFSLWHKRFSKS